MHHSGYAVSRQARASGSAIGCAGLGVALITTIAASTPVRPGQAQVLPLESRWTAELPSEPTAPPVTDFALVIVPLRDGSIAARRRADGSEAWTVAADARVPLRYDQGLVVTADDRNVSAIRADDGALAWRAAVGEIRVPLAATGGWVVGGTTDGDVVALRIQDGSLVWRRSAGAPLTAAPAVDGDRVYLPLEGGNVAAWHLEDGRPVWQRTLGGEPGRALALADRLFVGASDNFLYCLARSDGEMLWRWRTAADVVGLPSADDRRLYFASFDNVLRALDRRTGVQRWKQLLPGRLLGEPQVVGGVVMAATPAAKVLFFRADTGHAAGVLDLSAPIAGGAALDVGAGGADLFVTTVDATGAARLVAFGPGLGPPLAPLRDMPGRALWPEIPLATRPLPIGPLVPPGLPTRVG